MRLRTFHTSSVEAAQHPLQILRRDGYAIMRAGSVPEGAKVRFCVPSGTDIINDTLKEFCEFRENRVSEADALVLFSCKEWHLALEPLAEDEVRPIQQLWNVPLIGFYTYGEMGSLGQNHLDFHNETCVLVTLKDSITDG